MAAATFTTYTYLQSVAGCRSGAESGKVIQGLLITTLKGQLVPVEFYMCTPKLS
jgi:hypothetical protein